MLQSLVDSMNAKVKKLPDKLAYLKLEAHLLGIVLSWLVQVLDKCLAHIQSTNTLFVGSLGSDGPFPDVDNTRLGNTIKELVKVMHAIKPDTALLLRQASCVLTH